MKKVRLYALIVQVAIEVILLIILFNTVEKARLSEPVFWIAWSFAFIVNLLVGVGLYFFTRKKVVEWVTIPVLYYVTFLLGIAYYVVGMIFMYLPITDQKWLWIIESILTIVYIVIFLYFVLGSNYINQTKEHVKKKVQYIREAQVICEGSANVATHQESKKALEKLAEDIRFSDPMSDESIASYEKELFDMLLDIDNAIKENEAEDVTVAVKKASQVLSRRNSLVRIRK